MDKEIKTKDSISFEEIAVIEKATGGVIKTYEWWDVKGVDGNFKSTTKPSHEEDIIFHGVLENSFLSKSGEYIGNLDQAKWYVKNRLKVYDPYPHGVAEAYDEDGLLIGYCGYTHRGACIFRIGDRVFDKKYKPIKEDYNIDQWEKWQKEYDAGIARAEKDNATWWAEDIKRDGVGRYISFKLRGKKVIETMEEAAQAASNLSEYLS